MSRENYSDLTRQQHNIWK